MKPRDVLIICFAALSALSATAGDGIETVVGDIEWPTDWVVFTGFDKDSGILRAAPKLDDGQPVFGLTERNPEGFPVGDLYSVPQRLVDSEGREYHGIAVRKQAGQPYDLGQHFDQQELTDVAWLFANLESPEAMDVTIGFGADWWFTAWVNGELAAATPLDGNGNWPPTAADHSATVRLQQGSNLIAVRVVTGRRSALFTAGGPHQIRAEIARRESPQNVYRFNDGIAPLRERIPFELSEQAFATAFESFDFPEANVDLKAGRIVGVEPLPKRQRYAHRTARGTPQVLDTEFRSFEGEPLKLLLSKSVYPATDLHLDAVLWITPPPGVPRSGTIEVSLLNANGVSVASDSIDRISPTGWFFSMGLPPGLYGGPATIEVTWIQNDREIATIRQPFHVSQPAEGKPVGTISIRLPNPDRVHIDGFPQTIGVPFPEGILYNEDAVRLVDENERELTLQTKVAARWSRFGAIKWLLCDFTADLHGNERNLTLRYGPGEERKPTPDTAASIGPEGAPAIDAGRLTVDGDGVSYNFDGVATAILAAESLRGGFVQDASGNRFTIPGSALFEVEQNGPVKTVLRTAGWFQNETNGEQFCNAVSRIVLYRDSPIIRLFHTWIFTGDSRRDRIAEMGWDFKTAATIQSTSFLLSFEDPKWKDGNYLVQFDHDEYAIDDTNESHKGRTAGVLVTQLPQATVFLGVKDFWQNFPNELGVEGSKGFAFRNWPRHNPPAKAEPVTLGNAHRNRYAHEGKLLDFTPSNEYFEKEIWEASSSSNLRSNYWRLNDPDSINAQGVAKTEEMVLYFAAPGAPDPNAAGIMRGLTDERLRAVVDPAWMAASGVFGKILHADTESYPLDEAIYAEVIRAPSRWNEALEFYGMWLHGDTPAWAINPLAGTASLYRMLRRNHHGWPLKWMPYARSGDPELLKFAEAATRNLTDVGFCHFVTEAVDTKTGIPRAQGRWSVASIPWVSHSLGSGPSSRGISEDVDYLLDSYYLTGYRRSIDVLKIWMELVKISRSHLPNIGRASVANMHVALDTYKATFDPWFLIAAHEIASLHREDWSPEGEVEQFTDSTVGHFWKPADYDFYRYTGDERHRSVALNVSSTWSSPWAITNSWPILDVPYIEEAVNAYRLSGDQLHLARAAAYVDWANMAVFDGDRPVALRGSNTRYNSGVPLGLFTGYYIQQMPYALKAFKEAGSRPQFTPNPFHIHFLWQPSTEINGEATSPFTSPPIWLKPNSDAQATTIRLACERYDSGVVSHWQMMTSAETPIASGKWQMEEPLIITADIPEVAVKLSIEGNHPNRWRGRAGAVNLTVPVALPHVSEVIEYTVGDDGIRLPGGLLETQLWFHVPQGTESFWIEIRRPRGIVRRTLWDPSGNRVWDYDNTLTEQGTSPFIRTEITVAPGTDGQLWRITAPGNDGVSMRIDPSIPPFFSVSKNKWFDPRAK